MLIKDPEDKRLVDSHGVPVTVDEDGNVVRALDPIMAAARRNWDELGYLFECYHNFLKAVQLGASKDYQYKSPLEYELAGKPKWNQHDSFADWCHDQETMLQYRLDELKRKYLGQIPSDANLIHVIEKGQVEDPHPYLGHRLDIEEYEIYEWILRKSIEAIANLKKGLHNLRDIVSYSPKEL